MPANNPRLKSIYLLMAACLLTLSLAGFGQTKKILHSFQSGNDGALSDSNLIPDGSGGFYGMTHTGGGASYCGGYGCGTFFHLTQSGGIWVETVLYSFLGVPDVYQPDYELVQDKTGNIYGTSTGGGTLNEGVVFELSPPSVSGGSWTETILYSFTGGLDGAVPFGGVVFGPGGGLYGITRYGGPYKTGDCYDNGCGVVFQLLPPAQTGGTWTESAIYNFGLPVLQGDMKLTVDNKGTLYGPNEGAYPHPTIFMLLPPSSSDGNSWFYEDIYSFTDGADGQYAASGVIFDKAGRLYGTSAGGTATYGTVFQLVPPATFGTAWTFNLVHSFGGPSSDGSGPEARLTIDSQGNLYGTTVFGGFAAKECYYGCGTVFELSPSTGGTWTESLLHKFIGGNDGYWPKAPLTISGGTVYGTTWLGGTANYGTVFAIRP